MSRARHGALVAALLFSVAAHVFLLLSAPVSPSPSAAPQVACDCPQISSSAPRRLKYRSATALTNAMAAPADNNSRATGPTPISNSTWYRDIRAFVESANGVGTDKANMHQYHPLYARVLAPFREAAHVDPSQRFNLLEIGIGCTMGGKWGPAGGYHMLKSFLPNAKYHGFEFDFKLCEKRWRKMGAESDATLKNAISYLRENVIVGDQGSKTDRDRAIDRFGMMDIIIDDGSHVASHQRETFRHLFLSMLRPGGVYIIEDLNANFVWKYRELFGVTKEGQRARKTMVHYIHDLITALAFPFWDQKNYVFDAPFELDEPVLMWVEDIVCVHEACAVTKKREPFNKYQTQLFF